MRAIITILILFLFQNGFSQFHINLSPRHQNSLSEVKSGHRRIKQFHKYFKRDSSKHLRKLKRQARRSWDSMVQVTRNQELLRSKFPKMYATTRANPLDSLNDGVSKWRLTLSDTTASDSLKEVAVNRIRDLTVAKLRYYPNFNSIEDVFHNLPDTALWQDLKGQVPEVDSLSRIFASPRDLVEHSSKESEKRFTDITASRLGTSMTGGPGDFPNPKDSYKKNIEPYQNLMGSIKANNGKVSKEMVDSLVTNPKVLEVATQKVSQLFSKYSSFSNSNDLSDARRRTSLNGKTFFERIVLGGSFNIISTDPVSIDCSPQVGYRFTSLFMVGIGMNYRATFGDSITHQSWNVSSSNTAFKVLTSYEIINSWYVYAESEFSRSKVSEPKQNKGSGWNANYFVGVGRKFLVHPKLFMTLTALYNLNPDSQNQIYPQRFQIRLGFQTSDLAFRKKQINYDPNR